MMKIVVGTPLMWCCLIEAHKMESKGIKYLNIYALYSYVGKKQ